MSCDHLAKFRDWLKDQKNLEPDIIMLPGDLIDNGCRPFSEGAEAELAFWTELAKLTGKPIIIGTQTPRHFEGHEHRPLTVDIIDTSKMEYRYSISKQSLDYSNKKAHRIPRPWERRTKRRKP